MTTLHAVSSSSPTVVLLAGAGLSPQVWNPLRERLPMRTLAVRAFPVTPLEGHGPVVLVAHSGAGACLPAWVQALGPRVVGAVTVSSLVPPPGARFVDAYPWPLRWVMPVMLRLMGTRPPDNVLRTQLCAGLSQEHTRLVLDTFTPEPLAYYTQRVPACALPGARVTCVLTNQDKTVPLALQKKCAARFPGADVVTLHGGHLPMLEQPEVLADVIVRACSRKVPGAGDAGSAFSQPQAAVA